MSQKPSKRGSRPIMPPSGVGAPEEIIGWFTYKDLSNATGISVNTLYVQHCRGFFNPRDLSSVLRWLVSHHKSTPETPSPPQRPEDL
jgi:hypothetical protein